jgi:hypothetical protein
MESIDLNSADQHNLEIKFYRDLVLRMEIDAP